MRFWLIFAILAALTGQAAAHDLPLCYDPETAALRQVDGDELQNHGGGPLGPVDYPAGTLHRNFLFGVVYVIDIDGHVSCITAVEDLFMSVETVEAERTPQRQALLDDLAARTFTPFTDANGQPEKVMVYDRVDEEELPMRHVAPPEGDLASTVIRLETSGHRTPEHGYTIKINGNGDATFSDGGRTESYRIPPDRITAMLDLANQTDFWSLKDVYLPPMDPKYPWLYAEDGGYYRRVAITRGGRTKTMTIYDWGNSGAPLAARDLMVNMALLGGLDLIGYWGINHETIALKEYNNFDFSSKEGGHLLIRAVYADELTDSDIYRLIAKGAPVNYVQRGDEVDTSLLDAAIDAGRTELADNLILQGALLTDDKIDAQKATRALVHAVRRASPDMVRRILAFKPGLTFRHDIDEINCRKSGVINPIVTFVGISRQAFFEHDHATATADLIDVTTQLVDAGADLNSRDACGGNILTHAIDNNQLEFARWLLDRGVSPKMADGSWPYMNSYPAEEEMTVLLLEAGAASDAETLGKIVSAAQRGDEPKVEAWLRAHGKWPEE